MESTDPKKKDDILMKALKNYVLVDEAPQQSQTVVMPPPDQPIVQIRFRPPFLRTCTHDARGDAINLVMENMALKSVPLWASHILGNMFVDEYKNRLLTHSVGFVDNLYDGIDASLWCRQVIASFEEFMRKIVENEDLVPVKPTEWNVFSYSVYSNKNRKPKMEDRHVILPTLMVVNPTLDEKFKNDSFFAVFDGHNGAECASYATTHFYESLLSQLNSTPLSDLLAKTFEVFDKRLTLRCENEHLKSGTTACCVYVSDGRAYLGWCGDSSIGVFKSDNTITTLTTKHTPDQPEERERIESAGGVVLNIQGEPRVNGVLNISRSLGDISAKPMVSSTPDTDSVELVNGRDLILFLSSDGIWEMLSVEEIAGCVTQFVKSHPHTDYEKLAEFIGQKAREEGATDNLTLIAVFLGDVPNIWQQINNKSSGS